MKMRTAVRPIANAIGDERRSREARRVETAFGLFQVISPGPLPPLPDILKREQGRDEATEEARDR